MVSKLKGAEIRCHDLSKTLNGLLDKQELFRREFMAGVEEKAQASPSGKAKADVKEIERRLDARLAGNYEKVQTLLEKTSSAYRAFNQAAADAVLLQKRVAGLGDRPMLLKVLTGALVLKDLALTPLGANGLVQVSELATNIGPTAAGWGYDRLTEGVLDRTFLGAGA
jgi:hypothetical protein